MTGENVDDEAASSAELRAVVRDDGELCGFVRPDVDGWTACTVFGSEIAAFGDEADAVEHVRTHALALLQERWTYVEHDEIVCIQEASPHGVRLALGYYSMPGVPTVWIPRADIEAGRATLVPPG